MDSDQHSMVDERLKSELEALIQARDFPRLRQSLEKLTTPDLAELLGDLSQQDTAIVFRVLHRERATLLFEYLPRESQEALLHSFAEREAVQILADMSPDDRTTLLEELPGKFTRRLLNMLPPEELAEAKSLLGYPEDSIGRLMTPDYVRVKERRTVKEVLDHIRQYGRDSETLSVIYVVDDRGRLLDDIRVREFLLAPLDRKVSELMRRRPVALSAFDDQETAVRAFEKYDRVALPVTDSEGVLLGIVTVDDVMEVAEDETTEDFQKMGGMEALDTPYLNTPLTAMVRKRAGWLIFLLLGQMFTAAAMGIFEGEIQKAVVLALFVPLIIASGGNSGSQATSLVIRAMALGEVGYRDWWRVLRLELVTGLSLGMILGLLGFLRIAMGESLVGTYGDHWVLLGVTIGVVLVGIVCWGTVTGAALPIIMERLGADPAASSAPFVATLVDVTGVLIYFGVATLILRGTLL